MEAYILLLLFFLGLPLAIYLVLSDPAKGTSPSEPSATQKTGATSNTVAYAVVAALLAFFCVLTILLQRSRT